MSVIVKAYLRGVGQRYFRVSRVPCIGEHLCTDHHSPDGYMRFRVTEVMHHADHYSGSLDAIKAPPAEGVAAAVECEVEQRDG